MRLFKKIKEQKINFLIDEVNKKYLFRRYLLLVIGCFISSLAFNVFFLQYGIVCFGVSGLSIVISKYGISPNLFILIANIALLFLSFIFLGYKQTRNSIVGSLLFPLMVTLTSYLVPYIKLGNIELIVVAIFGAVASGIGYGLIFKTGFTTGGTDILNQIISKYTKISLGRAMLIVDGLVVLSAKLVFDWEIVLYGFIVLYIISYLIDKVVLGISNSKAFYIITSKEKEEEIREFLLQLEGVGATLINVRGGYSESKQILLLAVAPTREYFIIKEGLKQIDENVFFLVCDAYEVSDKEGV